VVCFLQAAVIRKSSHSTGFAWVVQNKILQLQARIQRPSFFFFLSEALDFQNHGVVIWKKDDSRGAAEEEPESPE